MKTSHRISREMHEKLIQEYREERPLYVRYAGALERVLKRACATALPWAEVQSRAKALPSFAEKCARKYDAQKQAVKPLTDLCGARVIVQTEAQVDAVDLFVQDNFTIHQREEKTTLLGTDRVGYRDLHFIVALPPDKARELGFTDEEIAAIGGRKAELQIRTWVQHAWADTLHDRMYKNPLPLAPAQVRNGNLLAALLEQVDRNLEVLADDLDGMMANYSTLATRGEVQDEIHLLGQVLAVPASEPGDEAAQRQLRLRLARLRAACGDYPEVVGLLRPAAAEVDSDSAERLQELGHALVRLHRGQPSGAGYQEGLDFLVRAAEAVRNPSPFHVRDLRRRESLCARILARLAEAWEPVRAHRKQAVDAWREAHEREPRNPYVLAGMLGLAVELERSLTPAHSMVSAVRAAVRTCEEHAAAGIELPHAYFTAGRLRLLLPGGEDTAVDAYARGIRHARDDRHCLPRDLLEREKEWVSRFCDVTPLPEAFPDVLDFLELAARATAGVVEPARAPCLALIVAGGAGRLGAKALDRAHPFIRLALEKQENRVISGGTRVGVPGCVGEISAQLAQSGRRRFHLTGYLPELLPQDAPRDERYDTLRKSGRDRFSARQILDYWKDVLDDGILPGQVLCLGFGGGPVSLREYRVALAMGAMVAVASLDAGDAAATLLACPLWKSTPNLYPLPLDPTTLLAILNPAGAPFPPKTLDIMGKAFHDTYVAGSGGKLPPTLRPWPDLDETYKKANREQAAYSVRILEACGFGVRPAEQAEVFSDFEPEEIEEMAELEHGRWNAERIRDGWRLGPRDDAKKLHPNLVPWNELPDGPGGVKRYDRAGVRAFPANLALAGLEVYRIRPKRSKTAGENEQG